MHYAMKIGPLPIQSGAANAYLAYIDGRLEAAVEPSDAQGLAALRLKCGRQPLVCEPALAKVAAAHGLQVAELPPNIRELKAAIAVTFDHGPSLSKVSPELIVELIDATVAFEAAAPWDAFETNQALAVRIESTGREFEGCVLGAGGEEFGLALYHQRGSIARLNAFLAEGRPEAAQSLACTTMLLASDRPCSLDAVRALAGVEFAPLVMHIERGEPCAAGPKDVAVLVAGLRAVTALVEGRPPRGETRDPAHRVVATAAIATAAAERPTVLYDGVGRNEPCPCGSGKKFKRCHLDAVEAMSPPAPSSPRAMLHQRDERLVADLFAYGSRRFGDDTIARRVRESLGDHTVVGQLVTPWLAYVMLFDGEPLAAHFLRGRGSNLTAADRRWIELQLATPVGVWEILRVDRGHGVDAVDLLTGARCFIHEVKASEMLAARDAIFARVVTDELSVFCGMHSAPLDPTHADAVVTQFGASPADNFAAAQRLFDLWDGQVAEVRRKAATPMKVTNTDGHDAASVEDRFALRGGSFDAVFARLAALDGINVDEHDRTGARFTFTRPGNAKHPQWANTVIGSARLTATRLVVQTNSLERAEHLTALLRDVLGELATWKKRTRDELPPGFGGENVMIDAQSVTSSPERSLREAYRGWLDMPMPSLGGRTPRQAVGDEEGRRGVHLMLKQQENLFARKPFEGPNLAQLRRELGLDELGQRLPNASLDRAVGSGRKISETLVDFAQPLLEADNAQRSEQQLRQSLGFAIDVWNATVIAAQAGISLDPATLGIVFASDRLEWIERLIARKRELFPDDLRMVGNWDVIRNRDRLDIQMEAHVTDSLRSQLQAAGVT